MEELSVCIHSVDDLGAFFWHGGQGEILDKRKKLVLITGHEKD